MRTFCINMKEAGDRRIHCIKQFEREGLDVKFIRGFDGRASKLRHESEWIDKQIGACISHYMAVEEVRHNNLGTTLILEDDIILEPDFKEKLKVAMAFLPDNWDVAALSWFVGEGFHADFENTNDYWQQFMSGDVWGQAAYLVNGSPGAEAILNCITPIRSHIDRMFWECCRDKQMTGYFLKEPLAKQSWEFQSQNV